MAIVQSLPSQTSIAIPSPIAPVIDMVVILPEVQNPFYTGMAALLNSYVFNATSDFVVTQLTPVEVKGAAIPGSAIILLVNGLNQNPSTTIYAAQDGTWSTTVLFAPGQNVVQAQYIH